MSDAPALMLAWVAGGMLGAFFFGGLWWTVRRVVSSDHPALWCVASLTLRMGITLAGFLLVGLDHWDRLLLCLLGFVMARLAVTWIIRPSRGRVARSAPEAIRAP